MNLSSAPQHEDLDLITRATAGQRVAAAELATRLNPAIRSRVARVLRRLTPGRLDETDDIAQIVWLVLFEAGGRQLRAFRPERGISLEAYVGMIAEREVRNTIARAAAAKRGASRTVALSEEVAAVVPTSAPHPEAQAIATDLADRLLGALVPRFPERARPVLTLCVIQGARPDEAAHALEMPAQQVHNWFFRFRKASRDFLEAA
jgi:RNA polymerase sigma factor (sigma-70 family)